MAVKPLWLIPLFRRKGLNAGDAAENGNANGVAVKGRGVARKKSRTENNGGRSLPRPAMRWVGPAGRVALRPFDFEADVDAVCAFQEETYSVNFPDFQYTSNFASAFRHDLRRAALDGQHGLFVLDEGGLIGFLWLVVCQNSWTNERFGYVNNIYIVDEKRGLGLGREFMQQSDDFFRSRGVKIVRLTVTAANTAACALYTSAGYTTERFEMEKIL